MKQKQQRAILLLLCDIAAILNLKNWTLSLGESCPSFSSEDKSAAAQIEAVKGQHSAIVYLAPDFLEMGHEEILHVLIHEVMHLHFTHLRWAVEDQAEIRSMSVAECNQFVARAAAAEELAVDDLARSVQDLIGDDPKIKKALKKITPQVEEEHEMIWTYGEGDVIASKAGWEAYRNLPRRPDFTGPWRKIGPFWSRPFLDDRGNEWEKTFYPDFWEKPG